MADVKCKHGMWEMYCYQCKNDRRTSPLNKPEVPAPDYRALLVETVGLLRGIDETIDGFGEMYREDIVINKVRAFLSRPDVKGLEVNDAEKGR